jgi:hypothetical protein
MSLPNYGSASQTEVLMLETINRDIDLLENVETGLDKRFSDMGKQTEASLRAFRVPLQTEMGGGFSSFNSDGGAYPAGLGPGYDQGQMTPYEVIIATSFTELAARIPGSGPNVEVVNPIDKAIADMQKKMSKKRNMLLQTSNTGQIGTVNATYAGAGANPVTMAADPFGARLIDTHDTIQVFNSADNSLRGVASVQDKQSNSVGGTDSITLDAVPGGTVAGDFIMVNGVAATTPLFFQGLQYIISPSSTGEYLGMSRSLSYTQAPALNANGAPLTLGTVLAFLTRMMQPLGMDAFESERAKNFWYGHPAQWFAYQTLGFAEQTVMITGEKTPKYDGVPRPFGAKTIAGIEFANDTTAAISKLYFMDQATMVRCRFHKGPQMLPGPLKGMYWPRISNGSYTTQNDVYFYDAVNYATRNPWANGVIYGLAIPGALSV